MTTDGQQLDNTSDFPATAAGVAERWSAEIRFAQKSRDSFYKRARRLEKAYLNESTQTSYSRFAIFWSNLEILKPAVYAKAPKLIVSRRNDDADTVARCAARILERAGNFDLSANNDFHNAVDPATSDYLICGQGTVWVRFDPDIVDAVPAQVDADPPPTNFTYLRGARAPLDFVSWEHWLCNPARTWEEVRWVARCVEMTQDECEKRFGAQLKRLQKTVRDLPFSGETPAKERTAGKDDTVDFLKRVLVWEIWDKEKKEAHWVVLGFGFCLDSRADPLRLDDFFPCPQPLLATRLPRSLVPKADYLFYQDQARELNDVTAKLAVLTEALQVIGVYDDTQTALQDLLKPNMNNRMVPVKSWAAFADKGGLKGVVDFWPLDRVIETIGQLEARRQTLIAMIYEITGISDIIRGATNPNETLGAQQIKSKFASLRLQTRQGRTAAFAGKAAAIKLEIMARHFPSELLARLAVVSQMDEDPGVIQAALQLIKTEPEFQYRVEATVDSMVELDMEAEKKEKTEFLGAVSNFVREASTAAQNQPLLAPLFMEFLKFGVRGFRVGVQLEGKIDKITTMLLRQLQQPKPPTLTAPEAAVKTTEMRERGATEREVMKLAAEHEKFGAQIIADAVESHANRVSNFPEPPTSGETLQ